MAFVVPSLFETEEKKKARGIFWSLINCYLPDERLPESGSERYLKLAPKWQLTWIRTMKIRIPKRPTG